MFRRLLALLPAALGAEAYEGDGTMLMQNRVRTNQTTQSTVCADGTDDVVFVAGAVVGCDTSWTTPGISSGDAACASGFWVCPGWSDANNLGLTTSLCSNSPAAGDFYASKQSSNGGWSCASSGTNDLWGCGKDGNGVTYQGSTCVVFTKAMGNQDYGSWSGLGSPHGGGDEVNYVTKGVGNGGVLCCADPSAPTLTPNPTPYPTPYPTPSPTYPPGWPTPHPTFPPPGTPGGGVAATGDPHLQNVHGERFDLMKPGKHVLINIPKGVVVENALFRVEAKASQLGGQCADMYFQEINITGRWVETKLAGGLRFQAPGVADESPNWMTFGKVEVKVAHGHTRQGIQYLNLYVKHLGHAGFAVGGLLGEDDHKDVMIPPASCTHRTSLLGEQTEGLTSASVSSVAMAIPERLDELTMQDSGSCECACGTPPDCTFDKTSCPDCK